MFVPLALLSYLILNLQWWWAWEDKPHAHVVEGQSCPPVRVQCARKEGESLIACDLSLVLCQSRTEAHRSLCRMGVLSCEEEAAPSPVVLPES